MKSSDKVHIEEIKYNCHKCHRDFLLSTMTQVHVKFPNGSEKILYCCGECSKKLGVDSN